MFLQKIETFFAKIIRNLWRDQSNTSHAVSHLESIFKKLQHVTFWLLNHCLYGQKWTGNNYFVKIRLTGSKLQIQRAATHALDRANRTTGRGICKKISFRFFVAFSTGTFYL